MPTAEYSHDDGPMTLDFDVTYSVDARGQFDAIDNVRLKSVALIAGKRWYSAWAGNIPPMFESHWEGHVESKYDSELAECVERDIEAGRRADAERRTEQLTTRSHEE